MDKLKSASPSTVDIDEPRFSESEACERLGLKSRITLHRYRKRKLIGFYRIANRIYYGQSHIQKFLAHCERKAA